MLGERDNMIYRTQTDSYWDYTYRSSPLSEIIMRRYESKIRKLAYIKWEQAGKPEGQDLEFWFIAEKDIQEKNMLFSRELSQSALPDYSNEGYK